jgi:O-antigen ligase
MTLERLISWRTIRALAWGDRRVEAPLVADLCVLGAYVAVRGWSGGLAEAAWLGAAFVFGIRWPGSALGIAVAIGMFPQHVRVGMTPAVMLIGASAIGFVVDHLLNRPKTMGVPTGARIAMAGAGTLLVATLLALIHALSRFDPALGVTFALRWTELAAGLGLFMLAAWAAATGSRRAVGVVIGAMLAALAVALLDLAAPGALPSIGLGWTTSGGAETDRATGSFVSPNRLGTVAAVAAVVGACLAVMDRRWRALSAASAAISTVVLALTFSRGAVLGLAIAGGAILATRSRRLAAAYAAVLVIAGIVLVPLLIGGRLGASGGSLGALMENDAGRIDAWLAGIRMILADPIFGQGFGAFRVLGEGFGATDGLHTAHNELIDLWAQAGVAAALGFAAIVGGTIAASLTRRRDAWAMAALGAIVVFVVASSFNVQSPFLAVTGPVWAIVAFGIARQVPGTESGTVDLDTR